MKSLLLSLSGSDNASASCHIIIADLHNKVCFVPSLSYGIFSKNVLKIFRSQPLYILYCCKNVFLLFQGHLIKKFNKRLTTWTVSFSFVNKRWVNTSLAFAFARLPSSIWQNDYEEDYFDTALSATWCITTEPRNSRLCANPVGSSLVEVWLKRESALMPLSPRQFLLQIPWDTCVYCQKIKTECFLCTLHTWDIKL